MNHKFTVLAAIPLELTGILSHFPEQKSELIREAFSDISSESGEYLGEPPTANIRIVLEEQVFRELIRLSQNEKKYINFIAGRKLSDYIIHKIMTTHEYIQINSAEDIDTSQIPLSAVSRYRYIDKNNNRYALRFNLQKRQIEVTRLVSKEEVHIVSRKIFEEKNASEQRQTEPAPVAIPPEKTGKEPVPVPQKPIEAESPGIEKYLTDDIDLNIMDDIGKDDEKEEIFINDDDYITKTLQHIIKIKERIRFLINNLNGSRVFEILEMDRNIITDLSRELDLEIYQDIENSEKYFRELTEYPRPISYYIGKYEKSKMHIIKNTASNDAIMKLLVKWEMSEIISSILRKLKLKLNRLLEIINLKNDEFLTQLNYSQKGMFQDAKSAALLCVTENDHLAKKHNQWLETLD